VTLKHSTSSPKPLRLSTRVAGVLLLSQCLNLALLANELSLWMLMIIGLCLGWRGLMIWANRAAPSKWLLSLIALSGAMALAISGRQLGLLLTMLHLLAFSYVLKTLELKVRRDFYQLFLLGLFVLASALIFSQTLFFSILVGLVIIVNLSVLILYFAPVLPPKDSLQMAAKTLAQSIPLAVLLFIVFPRLSPFWQVPLANSAKTGLSETVTPGDIANLALSNELAFRVTFTGQVPLHSQMYWRALVMEDYDGRRWQQATANKETAKDILAGKRKFVPEDLARGRVPFQYQVIAEPNYQNWLFALDVASVTQTDIVQLPDYSLRSKKIISQSLSYQVQSFPEGKMDKQLAVDILRRNLRYPRGSNPRLEDEAKRLRAQYSNRVDIIRSVLAQIRQKDYYYTLQPPLLVNNSLDQFYFDTRSGFCVHYASAFTFLMRAAGIPARMVTGYLGGEYNPQGDYYSVFQYDAHAWAEVWLPETGWQRIDPTAAVSPERVEDGFSAAMAAEQSLLASDLFSLHSYKHLAWLNAMRLQLEAIDYQWTRWVIGFTAERQYNLLAKWFGKVQAWKTALIIAAIISGILFLLWLVNNNWQREVKVPQGIRLYQKALRLLEKQGVSKPVQMPVSQFSVQVRQKRPNLSDAFTALSDNFNKVQYRQLSPDEQEGVLKLMRVQLKMLKQLC